MDGREKNQIWAEPKQPSECVFLYVKEEEGEVGEKRGVGCEFTSLWWELDTSVSLPTDDQMGNCCALFQNWLTF